MPRRGRVLMKACFRFQMKGDLPLGCRNYSDDRKEQQMRDVADAAINSLVGRGMQSSWWWWCCVERWSEVPDRHRRSSEIVRDVAFSKSTTQLAVTPRNPRSDLH